MPQLAKIQLTQVSLDELINRSLTVSMLPEAERKKLIEHIKALPKEKQKEAAQVLLNEALDVKEEEKNHAQENKKIAQTSKEEMKKERLTCARALQKEKEERERKGESMKLEEKINQTLQ